MKQFRGLLSLCVVTIVGLSHIPSYALDPVLPQGVISDAYAQKVLQLYTGMAYVASNVFLRETVEYRIGDDSYRYTPLGAAQIVHLESELKKGGASDARIYAEIAKLKKETISRFEKDRKLILHLDLALQKFPPYRGTLYRGVRSGDFFKNLKKGETFMDRSYLSTSKSLESAKAFTVSNHIDSEDKKLLKDWERGPLITIQAIGENGRDISGVNEGESEVLFARDTVFRIKDIRFWPKERGAGVRSLSLEELSAKDKNIHALRQYWINVQNQKLLVQGYPRSTRAGDPLTFASADFKAWNKADKELSKDIRQHEFASRVYDKFDLSENDFEDILE